MPRRTHKQLAGNSGVTSNANMSVTNSYTAPGLRNFVPFSDTMPSTTAEDIVKSATMFDTTAQADSVYDVGTNANNRAFGQDGNQVGVVLQTAPDDPLGNDFLFIIAAEALEDADVGDGIGGYVHFELIGVNGDVDVFPYFSRFTTVGVSPAVDALTPRYCQGLYRVPGQTYLYATAKKGDLMQHWALESGADKAVMTGEVDVAQTLIDAGEAASHWRALQMKSGLNSGETTHCASMPETVGLTECSSINLAGAGSYRQYFYGWQWFVFADLPNNLDYGLKWTLDEWMNNPQGTKRPFSEWVVES